MLTRVLHVMLSNAQDLKRSAVVERVKVREQDKQDLNGRVLVPAFSNCTHICGRLYLGKVRY